MIVASGGFFTAGKDSVVVPLKLLKVSQDRSSFYLLVTKEAVKAIPVMPDQDYSWLTDEKWRAHNDQLFKQHMTPPARSTRLRPYDQPYSMLLP